jgi:hypothetical protein
MSPQVEAAWIALIGAGVGVGGTVTIAIVSFRSTLASVREQIEADRRNRIWEKQAAAYTDAIAVLANRQMIRRNRLQGVMTGTVPEEPPALIEWEAVKARLAAYASPAVLDALEALIMAGRDFETKVTAFAAAKEQAKLMADSGHPAPDTASERDAATEALTGASRLNDELIHTIRDELHAGTDRPPAPTRWLATDSKDRRPAHSIEPPGRDE